MVSHMEMSRLLYPLVFVRSAMVNREINHCVQSFREILISHIMVGKVRYPTSVELELPDFFV